MKITDTGTVHPETIVIVEAGNINEYLLNNDKNKK